LFLLYNFCIMLKYLAIFAVVIIASVFVSTQNENYAKDAAQESTQIRNPVSPRDTNEEQPQANTSQAKRNPPSWYLVAAPYFAWPNGVGAWAVFLTLFAIVEQTRETGKAAEAALRQIKIQEAGMAQWIDVEALGAEIAAHNYRPGNPDFVVNLSFEAVNNTSNVLTIKSIETIISMMPDQSEVFTLKTNVTLSPRKESESNRYAFFVPARSLEREWFAKGTVVTINGSITFTDCLGETRSDYFGGLYECREDSFVKLKALGVIPDRTVEETRIPRMTGKDISGIRWQ
jgi:hypothetical protein